MMPKSDQIVFSFNPIFTEDKKGRGFSGYFAEFPELMAQGENKEEVIQNLLSSIADIFEYRRKESFFNNTSQTKEPSVNLIPA